MRLHKRWALGAVWTQNWAEGPSLSGAAPSQRAVPGLPGVGVPGATQAPAATGWPAAWGPGRAAGPPPLLSSSWFSE